MLLSSVEIQSKFTWKVLNRTALVGSRLFVWIACLNDIKKITMWMFTALSYCCTASLRRRVTTSLLSALLIVGLSCISFSPAALAAGEGGVAVIYPDLGEPYRSIFVQIISGIEEKARKRVFSVALGATVDAEELNASLRRHGARVVIALGRQGVQAAGQLAENFDVVVGAVLSVPEKEARHFKVNSMAPDPALLFSRLRGMMPKAKRVFAVYNPQQNEWLMRLARSAARSQGLEFVAYEAQDLRGAMHAYQEIMSIADSRQDALWLPQDAVSVEGSAVLPMVLQESWDRRLVVFSSNVSHVSRGALFSLYPDNVEMGRQLAASALSLQDNGGIATSSVQPLREVMMAVNLRIAKHLGLDATRQASADLTFPEN